MTIDIGERNGPSPGRRWHVVERRVRNHESIKEVAMLVLSRKLGEKIVIDGGIVITIVKLDRHQVRLGIEAPGDVPVWREELLNDQRSLGGAVAAPVRMGS